MSERKSETASAMHFRDAMAYTFLRDFIQVGYPTPDPSVQVAAAYRYADLMMQFRDKQDEKDEKVQ